MEKTKKQEQILLLVLLTYIIIDAKLKTFRLLKLVSYSVNVQRISTTIYVNRGINLI